MKIVIRLLVDIGLLAAVYMFPWWLSIGLTLTAALVFPLFIEFFIFTGIVSVFIYGAFGHFPYLFLVLVIGIFMVIELSKRHLVFYSYR